MHGSPSAKIKELRDKGYTVGVCHRRPLEGVSGKLWTRGEKAKNEMVAKHQFSPTGGETEVTITQPQSIPLPMTITTMSVCSEHDHFNYNLGLRIALGRALKLLPRD